MTYDTFERSEQSGAPVELYTFARNSREWLFTSAEDDYALDSDTYTSAPITRTAVETSPEQVRNAIKLTVPRNFAIAELFRVSPPTDIIAVTVRRVHRTDNDVAVIWIGRVLNVSFEGAQAVILCEPVSSSLKRTGLRRLYQKQCPHPLYSSAPGCGVNKASFAHATTVSSISGLTVTVASLGAHPYAGGYIEYEDADGNFERRFIRSFSGLVLTLSQPLTGAEATDAITVYPGCDHTMETCNSVFSNLPNYGGTPYIPTKNPFDGTPVY